MKKYKSIFKEKMALRENSGIWEEFVNIMEGLADLNEKVSVITKNAEFFTKMKDLIISADLEAVSFISNNNSFMILPKNFSHFETGSNKIIVFSKGNGSFIVSWK